ncbi:MAG: phage major capsid protein [Desulfurellales bacterium]|nr:MAG: phage major capsid protein [Desulfurellales bacterium]
MTKPQMQARLNEVASRMESLVSDAEASAAGVLTAEQVAEYDALKDEAGHLVAGIEACNTTEAARAQASELRQKMNQPEQAIAPRAPLTNAGPTFTKQRECIQDDPKRGFQTFGHFALAVMDAGPNPATNRELVARVAAGTGMSAGILNDGGVFVPPAFSTALWDQARMASDSMLGMTTQIPIDSGVESIEFPTINETSRADGSRWGGIQGRWKAELTEMSASQPKFSNVKLSPQELYVFAYISDKMLRRAPGAATAVLERAASDEIAFKVGAAIFEGDGNGKPLGFKSAPGTVSVAKETGQAASTVVLENINKMWSRCHAGWRNGAVWLINQDVEPALESLAATVGTGGVPVYLPAGGVADTPNARLKGRPVIVSEYCSTLGTVGDICLVNLNAYATAVRGTVDQQYSMHLKFDYAQTAFRIIFEVDGQPLLKSAITPFKGNNTLSPFVTLATRS